MRERHPKIDIVPQFVRITPAYAGKTHRFCDDLTTEKDHPRVCGKDARGGIRSFWEQGSPPRMRERQTAF